MKSAAGNLIIWIGLMIVDLSGIAARSLQCKPLNLVSLVEHEIDKTIRLYQKNNSHVTPKPKEMHQLRINVSLPEEQQRNSAMCGLIFMEEALQQVLDHRNKLNIDADLLKDVVYKVENNLKPCLKLTFNGHCEKHYSKPKFPVKNYEAKQWSLAVLELSRDFLNQFKVLLKKTTEENQ